MQHIFSLQKMVINILERSFNIAKLSLGAANLSLLKHSSFGSMILLTITLKLKMVLQDVRTKVGGNVMINIPLSNIFLTSLLPGKYLVRIRPP